MGICWKLLLRKDLEHDSCVFRKKRFVCPIKLPQITTELVACHRIATLFSNNKSYPFLRPGHSNQLADSYTNTPTFCEYFAEVTSFSKDLLFRQLPRGWRFIVRQRVFFFRVFCGGTEHASLLLTTCVSGNRVYFSVFFCWVDTSVSSLVFLLRFVLVKIQALKFKKVSYQHKRFWGRFGEKYAAKPIRLFSKFFR